MSTNDCPPLIVLLLGDHHTGKTRYLNTLHGSRFSAYIPGVAYNVALKRTIPNASPLEDPSAWRGWRGSDGRKGQHIWSTKKNTWDVVAGLTPNDRLRLLAYPHTDAVALCFSVVDRESFRSIRERVCSHYIGNLVGADVRPSGILKRPIFSPMSQYYSWGWNRTFEMQVVRPYPSPIRRQTHSQIFTYHWRRVMPSRMLSEQLHTSSAPPRRIGEAYIQVYRCFPGWP